MNVVDEKIVLLKMKGIVDINFNCKDIDAIYCVLNRDDPRLGGTVVLIKNNSYKKNDTLNLGTKKLIDEVYNDLGVKLNIEYTSEFNYMLGYNDLSNVKFYRAYELANCDMLFDKTGKYTTLRDTLSGKNNKRLVRNKNNN